MPREQGTGSDLTSYHHDDKLKPTKTEVLKQSGIQNYQRYEAIADLPMEDFERHIENTKKTCTKTAQACKR